LFVAVTALMLLTLTQRMLRQEQAHQRRLQAMLDASRHFVNLDELQRAVGTKLAEITHNEAAYVSTGAAAGLVLATAACVAGTDPAAIARLPDTTGLKNEVIIHKSHRNGYDHAVRQVGVKIVEIGMALSTAAWELEEAINEKTAAIFWFQGAMSGHGDLPLEHRAVARVHPLHHRPLPPRGGLGGGLRQRALLPRAHR
jgi:L-seryl-tRNA(Ser) seleniumtransferase